jgi:TPR repeat protein
VTVTWAVRQQLSIAEHEITGQLHLAGSRGTDITEPPLDEAEHNYRKGLELLRRSAQRGARSTLPDAALWLRQAAEDGHLRAQLLLGVLYEDGSGVIQDYEQALEWYRLAASQGDTVAMYRVGSMLRRGVGADKDLIKAYAWCNIAAARGHQDAAVDRDQIGSQLSPEEMKEAQQQSRTFDEELPYIVAKPFMLPAGL